MHQSAKQRVIGVEAFMSFTWRSGSFNRSYKKTEMYST